MKIKLKPIEIEVDSEQWHDARTAYVDIRVGRDRLSVPKRWAEPVKVLMERKRHEDQIETDRIVRRP